ncbi:MAG TPA: hypothetical protein VLN45_06945 [Ignavibacteriaceae bacterium]|nr:hypothetical protein [Ignavibacteriaceae bacterium]
MQNKKTNYDTLREIEINQYRCIFCGEIIDDNGICEDCLEEFPIKSEENQEPNFQNLSNESERIMSTNNDFTSIISSSISKLDEQLGKISSDISNAAKEKQFDEISKLASDANHIKDFQFLLNKILDDYEDLFEYAPTSLAELIKKTNEEIVIDPNNPPNLSFTKIIEVEIDNESPKNWSNLIRSALKVGVKKGLDFNALQKITSIL